MRRTGFAAYMVGLFMACAAALAPASAQTDLSAILKRFKALYSAGDYAGALIQAKRLEAGVKAQFGTSHSNYAVALNNLAVVYETQGNYPEAEGHYRRALAIKEKAVGPNHLDWPRPSTTWRTSTTNRANTGRPKPSTAARWRSGKKRKVASIPISLKHSTTWPSCTGAKTITRRPRHFTAAPFPSRKRPSAPTIRRSPQR